jgi:hypothetical protein
MIRQLERMQQIMHRNGGGIAELVIISQPSPGKEQQPQQVAQLVPTPAHHQQIGEQSLEQRDKAEIRTPQIANGKWQGANCSVGHPSGRLQQPFADKDLQRPSDISGHIVFISHREAGPDRLLNVF